MAETRKVGSLEVTVAGLGCNNFGMRMDADARQGGRRRRASTPGSTTSTPPRATGEGSRRSSSGVPSATVGARR